MNEYLEMLDKFKPDYIALMSILGERVRKNLISKKDYELFSVFLWGLDYAKALNVSDEVRSAILSESVNPEYPETDFFIEQLEMYEILYRDLTIAQLENLFNIRSARLAQ